VGDIVCSMSPRDVVVTDSVNDDKGSKAQSLDPQDCFMSDRSVPTHTFDVNRTATTSVLL